MTKSERICMDLRECARGESCRRCSRFAPTYGKELESVRCVNELMSDAADMIEALSYDRRERKARARLVLKS